MYNECNRSCCCRCCQGQVPRALPGRRESLVCKVLRDSREKQALRVRRDREERWGRREKQAPRARRDREERWGRREK